VHVRVHEPLRVSLASQTPPVRFMLDFHDLAQLDPELGDPVDLGLLREGVDYKGSAGGVPIMLRAMLPLVMREGKWRDPVWVSLNPSGPPRYILDGIRVHSVALDPAASRLYGQGKERIWSAIHGLDNAPMTPDEFRAYAAFNWEVASKLLEVMPGSDVAYVHDFQLLQVGALLGLSTPAVFRWHIPFRLRQLNPYLRRFIVRCLESYDAVVVSTRRDLEGLVEAGFRGRAHQQYPYVEPPPAGTRATPQQVQAFNDAWGLREDDPVVLIVARMDPIKGQDRVIRAMRTVRRKVPGARLMVVGNGSFTSSQARGLGHPKGRRWKQHLEETVKSEQLSEAVTFTGYLGPQDLEAGWACAHVVALPSTMEGFGTTAVEAWMRKRPVVLSRGAGAAELVVEGVNGFTYEPDDIELLASHLIQCLADGEMAQRIAERAEELSAVCDLSHGAESEDRLLRESILRFQEDHRG
jgi:glycosyltransferase involved in cell wall biosynthesis